MVAIPAIKTWGDIDGPINKRRVERKRKRKKTGRNIPQRECERKRVKRAGGQPGESERHNQQTVTVNQGKERRDYCKYRRRKEQNLPRPYQSAQIYGKRADEHQSDVEGAADPGAVVVTNPDIALEIGQTKRQHAAGERDNSCAHDYAENPEQRTLRQLVRCCR